MIKAYINDIECALYYDQRLKPEQAPEGHPYMYQLRHDEDNWIRPISIEKCVWVNFLGTVFMKNPIRFGEDGFVEVKKFKMGKNDLIGLSITNEFMNKLFNLHT